MVLSVDCWCKVSFSNVRIMVMVSIRSGVTVRIRVKLGLELLCYTVLANVGNSRSSEWRPFGIMDLNLPLL